MNPILIASADQVIEQLLIQCWLFEARGGGYARARARAEVTLERLLSRGLPYERGPGGALRLDPYAANNMLKSRAADGFDDAWSAWQETTRRNATSLQADPHVYRFTIRREWHLYSATGRQLIFRLPLPLRGCEPSSVQIRLLEPAQALLDQRTGPGRVELRLDPAKVRGPVIAELSVQFVAGETRDAGHPSSPLGAAVSAEDELWLRDREGLIVSSASVCALAQQLAAGRKTARDLLYATWDWLMDNLSFGDVHRSDLDTTDPLGGLLRTRRADCVLGSSLLSAICRHLRIPARVVSGFLMHPANLGPHSWAEVKIAPQEWVPFDFGSWCYCAGNSQDPLWGRFYRGRVDGRLLAEIAPREFTGWGSAPPPERWFRLEALDGDRIVHSLHTLPEGALFRRDLLSSEVLGPAIRV
jgi:hypothetical protein